MRSTCSSTSATPSEADYVITETGGIPIPGLGPGGGVKLPVTVGEKGCFWAVVTVHGTPGHGSQPYETDNALVKAAEVVRRLAEHDVPAEVTDTWRQFVGGLELPPEVAEPLLDPTRIGDVLGTLPIGMARQFHACTHTTMSTNLVRGGQKINTIPDAVELEIDVRGLPGWDRHEVEAMLTDAIGADLIDDVTLEIRHPDPATISPWTRRCGTRSPAPPRRSTRTARSSRCSWSAPPTDGTSVEPARRPTASAGSVGG